MQSSESTSDSDSSASKKTTVSVDLVVEDEISNSKPATPITITESAITTTATTTTTTATTTNDSDSIAPSDKTAVTTLATNSSTPTTSAITSTTTTPDSRAAEKTTISTKPNLADIGRHIDDLISRNEAIVDNWEYTSIRSYKQSVAKGLDESSTSTSGLISKTNSFSMEHATSSHSNKSNNPVLQRNLSTTSSSSSSSSSTTATSGLQQQQPTSLISNITNSISNTSDNITTTAPTKRKSTPCLIAPANLSSATSQFSQFGQAQDQSGNSNAATAAAAAATAAMNFMQRAVNLRSISEHSGPQQSLLFTNNNHNNDKQLNHANQFQISQLKQANNNWPTTNNSTDYPSDSTGYSSAGSLSHQSSLCDTIPFSTPQNLLPTSISALLAQSLPSITAAISAASAAPISTIANSASSTTPINQNGILNNSSITPGLFNQIEPRSRKRSYEVRNRDYYYQNQTLPSTSNSSNPFSSNIFAQLAGASASTSISSNHQNNSNNPGPLMNFNHFLDEQAKIQNIAMQQLPQHHEQSHYRHKQHKLQASNSSDSDQSDIKMARIREKMLDLTRQKESLELELQEEQERARENRQQQQKQEERLRSKQQHQNHIYNLAALVGADSHYLHILQQKLLEGQLPTTEHGAELLTQSLDSATPAYKCQLCKMSFWTKDLLNYHHTTQCPSIVNLLSLNLGQNQPRQQTDSNNQLLNQANEAVSLHHQLQQLEMIGDLSGDLSITSASNSTTRQSTLPKSLSPTGSKSHNIRPDISILNANFNQQQQNQNQERQNYVNALHSLRQPSIKIDRIDNNTLQRSLSQIACSSSNLDNIAARNEHDNSIPNGTTRHTSTLTPTTSGSSNLSLNSDISGGCQLRPNSASMTSTINNSALIGTGSNNTGSNNSLPLKKRKISAPGFI